MNYINGKLYYMKNQKNEVTFINKGKGNLYLFGFRLLIAH